MTYSMGVLSTGMYRNETLIIPVKCLYIVQKVTFNTWSIRRTRNKENNPFTFILFQEMGLLDYS